MQAKPLLLSVALLLGACTPEPVDNQATDPPRPDTELLRYHNEEAGQGLRADERVVESVRFALDTPVEIWGLQVYWARVDEASHNKLYLWPDFGYNYSSYDIEHPLWEKRLQVRPGDYRQPMDIWFDEPVLLDQPGLVYAGIEVEPGQPDLLMDRAVNADVDAGDFPQSMVWYPDRGVDAYGFPAIAPLPSNLMIGLHIVRAPHVDPWFEAVEDAAVGLGRVAFGDYDNDGDPDLMSGARLLRNDDGVFTDVSAAAGLEGIGCNGGVWGDYDNDGFADWFCSGGTDRLLHNNGDGTFTDVTAASGIDDSAVVNCDGGGAVLRNVPTEGAAWGDYDNDGYIDLYQANYECGTGVYTPDRLWHNNGDGTFTETGAAQGMDGNSAGRGVNWGDYDNDGDLDIFVSNYRLQRNRLWTNDGAGNFSNTANPANVGGNYQGGAYGHTIGSLWDDFDGDGDLDLFSANLAHPRFYDFSDRSEFLENALVGGSGEAFVSHRDATGLVFRETSSSPTALDIDNDGDRDLIVSNVYESRPVEVYEWVDNWQVVERHFEAGIDEWNTWGTAAADVNGDGLVDLAVKRVQLNQGIKDPDNNWLRVRLEGQGAGGTNRMAIGARVYVTAMGRTQMREVSGGHGTTCQDEATLHFGIGEATQADVRVVFPATTTEISLPGRPAGTRLYVHEDGSSETE